MGRCIVKIRDRDQDWYLEWSSVVDAPITYGMTLDELRQYIREEYGNEGLERLPARLERVEEYGYSGIGMNPEVNCAGKGGTRLTLAQIGEMYCRGEDAPEIEGVKWGED